MRNRFLVIAVVIGLLASALVLATVAGANHGGGGKNKATILKGRYEVPPADPDGVGHALIRLKPATSQVCWTLWVRRISTATAAHIIGATAA